MCTTCGCGSDEITIDGAATHDDHHTHDHSVAQTSHPRPARRTTHDHHHHETRTVSLEQDILAKNQLFAERNRAGSPAARCWR